MKSDRILGAESTCGVRGLLMTNIYSALLLVLYLNSLHVFSLQSDTSETPETRCVTENCLESMNRNDCLEDIEISHEDVDGSRSSLSTEEQRLSGLYYNFYTVHQLSGSVPGLSLDTGLVLHDQSVKLRCSDLVTACHGSPFMLIKIHLDYY